MYSIIDVILDVDRCFVPINTSANVIGHLKLDVAEVLLRPRERLNRPTFGQQVTLWRGRHDIVEEPSP
jgi:hypothetical protein